MPLPLAASHAPARYSERGRRADPARIGAAAVQPMQRSADSAEQAA
ncbi:MAG: hypothetical protein QGH58_10895 [Arenicellales bacterium]|nr:hypothetical protein [Arenicellales bacterium]MDP6792397.1 hypothetical protein [Arenicellales bacterium]MDP6920164.1 hypothetical protein [Arenicellales bacterium]